MFSLLTIYWRDLDGDPATLCKLAFPVDCALLYKVSESRINEQERQKWVFVGDLVKWTMGKVDRLELLRTPCKHLSTTA